MKDNNANFNKFSKGEPASGIFVASEEWWVSSSNLKSQKPPNTTFMTSQGKKRPSKQERTLRVQAMTSQGKTDISNLRVCQRQSQSMTSQGKTDLRVSKSM